MTEEHWAAYIRGWKDAIDAVYEIDEQNNPDEAELLDAEGYPSVCISFKQLGELEDRFTNGSRQNAKDYLNPDSETVTGDRETEEESP